jgi:hypothetical protein
MEKIFGILLSVVLVGLAGFSGGCKTSTDAKPEVPYNPNPGDQIPIYDFTWKTVDTDGHIDVYYKKNPSFPYVKSEEFRVNTTSPSQEITFYVFKHDPDNINQSCLRNLLTPPSNITVYWLKGGKEWVVLLDKSF